MVSILDQTGDVTRREVHKFAQLYDFPEYVKTAAQSVVMDSEPNLASTAFADVRNRQFKCVTKAATWMSYLFFLEKRSELHPKIASFVEGRLNAFVNRWGIVPDINALREKHAKLQKNSLPDSSYMIVWATDDGRKDRQYPLRNALEVKTAADWFTQHRDHFPYDDRKTMATRLLEKANEFGASLDEDTDEMLERQTGQGTYSPKIAAEHVRNRIRAAALNQDFKDKFGKLAEAIQSNPHLAQCPDTIQGLCRTVDKLDRMTKLSGNYSDQIPRPEDIFCQATYKMARAAIDECCTMLTGNIYNHTDFSKLALGSLRDAFGNDVAEAVADGINVDPVKLAEIAATFPRSDAELFDRIMVDNNIEPLMKQATAVKGPNFNELKHLAGIHNFITELPAIG